MRELTDLELDILKFLADNKGHALWELVKLLGKEKSNLSITLNRLEDEIELTNMYKIGYYDVINMNLLGLKFHEPIDPLSQYIRGKFKPDTLRWLDSDPPDFSFFGFSELNKLLDDPHLFDEMRFARVALSEKTREVGSREPKEQDLRYFNRLLLEEAYPECIARGRTSIIYKGALRKTTNPKSRQPKHHEIPYFINTNPLVLKFLVITMDLAFKRSIPEISKKDKDKLEELREQIEWQLISEHEYREIEDKIKYENYDDIRLQNTQEKYELLTEFLSSQYVLQYVKIHGFKWIIYRIHEMVRSWDRCWTLGESAINSGVIKDETDLECAEKLIQFHRSVEEGFRKLEQDGKGFEEKGM